MVVAAATLAWSGVAGAQISTFAGRQIGDGRLATAASLIRPFGVAFAPDGALLIADRLHHRIRRVDPATNVITTIAGSVAGGGGNGRIADQAELSEPARVRVVLPAGDLIIAESQGHTIRRVAAATGVITRIAGTGTQGGTGDAGLATAALLNGPTDAVPDGSGNILIADRQNHRIRRIDTLGVINTVAGNGTPGYTGDAILAGALLAQLNSPNCVLPIPGGGFYICDEQNHVIRKVDAFNTITTVAGNGTAGFADGLAAVAQFNGPVNLAFADGSGTVLLVADRLNNRIRRIDLTAGSVSTIAGNGTGAFTPDGAPAATSALFRPAAVTLAPDNRIVFAEDSAGRVRAIDGAGNLVTLAGDGVATFGGDGGPKGDAQFGQVKSVFRDKKGNLLVSDAGNNRVRRVDLATGVVETVAGSGNPAFGGDGGPAVDAGLTLSDVVEDRDGNLLISDTDNNRIRRVDSAGVITTVAGTGVPGFSGDVGPAVAAQLDHPTGIQLDAAGNLFIADFTNNVVRRVDTSGVITTVAGVQGPPGFNGDDIPATAASLANPTDVEIDEAGNLYIADFENHRIRRVDAATGMISTVAGSGVEGNTGDGGPAIAARLDNPSDVKRDETGAFWVADFGNHRLRRFTVGGTIDAAAGTGQRGYAGDGGDPLQARLLFPTRLLVLASDQVLVADRDNFVVRALGQITFVPPDCTGEGAATCVPGGGKTSTDCLTEFKLTPPGGRGPAPSLSCVDGDSTCDADTTIGQCTFRIGVCLNNEDPRLDCTPGAIASLKLTGKQAAGAGAQALLTGLATLAPTTPLAKARGVAFDRALSDRNRCTPPGDFVVVRKKKKKGTGKLGVVTAVTASKGKDKDRLKLTCLPPS
jgi:sugar lactone lactonase YvrE